MKIDDNPFERWGLDPAADQRTLTHKMRRRSRELDPRQRQQLQEDWRSLTSDAVARARWALLTPPQICDADSPWSEAEKLTTSQPVPELPALDPTVDDGLVLPVMGDETVDADPPFLPPYSTSTRPVDVAPQEDE